MTRDQIIARLRDHAHDLRRHGVVRAALFGSVARGKARPDSDIDVLVELDPGRSIDLFAYVGIVQFIKDLCPRRRREPGRPETARAAQRRV